MEDEENVMFVDNFNEFSDSYHTPSSVSPISWLQSPCFINEYMLSAIALSDTGCMHMRYKRIEHKNIANSNFVPILYTKTHIVWQYRIPKQKLRLNDCWCFAHLRRHTNGTAGNSNKMVICQLKFKTQNIYALFAHRTSNLFAMISCVSTKMPWYSIKTQT